MQIKVLFLDQRDSVLVVSKVDEYVFVNQMMRVQIPLWMKYTDLEVE